MPIVHIQLRAGQQQPDGTTAALPPPEGLLRVGPCLRASISVAQSIADQLILQGKVVPRPVQGVAHIDTGASNTCIDEAVAQQLQLPVIDVVQIASASHAATQQNVYPIQIQIPGLPPINAPRAIGAPLATQGLLVLIGRDVLRDCTLFYNGISGEFTLSI